MLDGAGRWGFSPNTPPGTSTLAFGKGEMRWPTIFSAAGDAWVLLFAAYFVLSIALGLIQHFRGKQIWETKAFGVLGGLHLAWVVPLALPLIIVQLILKWGLVALLMPILFVVSLCHKALRALRS